MPGLQRTEFQLRESDFTTIVRLVREETGIVLSAQKRDLVYGRLAKRLRAMGLRDFSEYCELLESKTGEEERRNMVNAITTNLTGFFREPHHFEFLGKTVLMQAKQQEADNDRRFRIWSAGCSSGEEPYSIAMTVRDKLGGGGSWDAKILATDIDTNMVAHGRAGRYDNSRMATVPTEYRRRFFRKADGAQAVVEEVKSLIVFNPLNLFEPWPMRGLFNVIFCRNVVIYFTKDDQRVLFNRFADVLVPGGWLFVGHSETLYGVSDRFHHLGRTIYQKVA